MSNFFKETDIDRSQAEAIVNETLNNCDDGELYLENHKSESIVLDDNKIKSSTYNSDQGYGFRAVTGEVVAYSHSNDISKESLRKSSDNLKDTLKSKKEHIIMKFLKLTTNITKILILLKARLSTQR